MLDSLETVVKNQKGKEKIATLNELSWQWGFSDINKALKYANEALSFSRKEKDSSLVAEAYNSLAIALFRKGDLDAALVYNFRALKIRKKSNDKRAVAASLSKIGVIYTDQGQYDLALKYQIEALKIFEALKETPSIGQTYNNICQIHMYLKNYRQSLKYAKLCMAIYKQIDFKYGEAGALGNIALYYEKTNQVDSCIYWTKKSRDLFEEVGSLMDVATCENNIGLYYRKKKDHINGLKYYRNALALSQKIDDQQGVAQYSANAAAALTDLNQLNEAEKIYREALKMADAQKLQKIRKQCYDGLANIYEKRGDFKNSLIYRKRFIEISDSLLNAEKSLQITEMETKYQTEKKEKENIKLTIENQKKELERAKAAQYAAEQEKIADERMKWLIGIVAGAIVLILLIVFLLYRKQQKQRARYDAEIIHQREEGLKAVITATEEERKRIAKDLHDGIGQQMGGLKIAWQHLSGEIHSQSPQHFKRLTELTKILDDTAQEVRSISHQMMPRVLTEMGLVPALEDMLNKTFGNSKIEFAFEHYGIQGRLNERLEISIYRITQELVNNIIKHSGATRASVQLIRNAKNLVLIVEDNGKGFDSEKSANGIGLMNIQSRVNTVNGEINYEPSSGSGTVATIRVPLD